MYLDKFCYNLFIVRYWVIIVKDKVKYLIIAIIVMVIVIISGTFAWLTYRSNKTAMVLTIGDLNDAMVTLRPYQIKESITPSPTYTSSKSVVNVDAVNNTTVPKKIKLYYKINSIDEDLISEDFKYTITKSEDAGETYSFLTDGDFSGASANQNYQILEEEVPQNETYNYKVYVWLDGTNVEQNELAGTSFDAELRAQINTNYMKADIGASSASAVVFGTEILRSKVESITFQNTIPSNITAQNNPIDVSVSEDNSVIAYFKDEDSNSKYEMYIAANGLIVPSSLEKFFSFYTNLTAINNFNYLDTSQVTSMVAAFQYASKLTTIDVSTFDTSNVTSMAGMFLACTRLTSLNLSNWDTSKVTSLQQAFALDINLLTLNLSGWDTSKVTTMYGMFMGHSSYGDMKLQTITGIENFDTSSVTNMQAVFQYCSSLTNLNLSGWDTSKVTTIENMFYGCSGLTTLNLTGWNTSNITNMARMTSGCSGLTSLNLSSFNTSSVTNMAGMFYNCSALTSLDLSGFNTSSVTNMANMFQNCSSLTTLDLSNWDTSLVTSMLYMFAGCSSLTSLNLSNFNTSNITDMSYMFHNCSSLTSLNISNFNTSSVTNMSYMFYNCSNLTSLNLSSFSTSSVTSMQKMFYECSGLTSLNLSNWSTSSVTDMSNMFSSCGGLTSLDLSSFNTSSVTTMAFMFDGSSNLKNIYVSDLWSVANLTTGNGMFRSCTSLPNYTSSVYDSRKANYATGGYLTYKAYNA